MPDYSIQEAQDQFITRNEPSWNGETARTYRKYLNTFCKYTTQENIRHLSDLNRWNVGQYTNYLLKTDYARATIQSKQKQARRWIKWLESQGLVEVGLHLAINPITLDDEEQTSSDILPPNQLEQYLSFYRNSAKWRGTRRHALIEVIGHTGARRSGIRALDITDWNSEDRTLKLLNREKQGTRIKNGDIHERKVVISQAPAEALQMYIDRERYQKHDNQGREPILTSQQGRPTKSTMTNWLYQATLPCVMKECPHGKERRNCKWTEQTDSSKCPSSESPHPVRRGSITWQLNIGRDPRDVAARAGTTVEVLKRYYDKPDLDAELRRRITEFDEIDICKHSDPSDVNKDLEQ